MQNQTVVRKTKMVVYAASVSFATENVDNFQMKVQSKALCNFIDLWILNWRFLWNHTLNIIFLLFNKENTLTQGCLRQESGSPLCTSLLFILLRKGYCKMILGKAYLLGNICKELIFSHIIPRSLATSLKEINLYIDWHRRTICVLIIILIIIFFLFISNILYFSVFHRFFVINTDCWLMVTIVTFTK